MASDQAARINPYRSLRRLTTGTFCWLICPLGAILFAMLDYFQGWEIEEVFFAVAIVLAVLFVIYAVTMIHQKLRVIENELQALLDAAAVEMSKRR